MWPSLIGVYFLPANGTQLAAIAADRTGSTKIGEVRHQPLLPAEHDHHVDRLGRRRHDPRASVMYGTSADAVEPPPVDTPTPRRPLAADADDAEPRRKPRRHDRGSGRHTAPEATDDAGRRADTGSRDDHGRRCDTAAAAPTPPGRSDAMTTRRQARPAAAQQFERARTRVPGACAPAIGEFLSGRRTVHFAPFALADRDGYTARARRCARRRSA